MNAPKLRFSDFDEKWNRISLGEYLTHIGSGVTPRGGRDVYTSEGTMLIRSQNVNNNTLLLDDVVYIDEITHQKMKSSTVYPKDVLLNITGASIGRTAVVPDNFSKANVNQHVCILRPNELLSPYFLKTFLESSSGQKNIFKDQAGQTREALNMQQIKDFNLGIPKMLEQEKIAKFFSIFNEKIQLQQEKIDLLIEQKKGFLQKIFKQELRFKNDAGQDFPEWRKVHLHQLVEQVKGNSFKSVENIDIPVLTISAKVGFVNQKDRFSEVIAGNSLAKYTELQKFDLSYNKGNSKTAKYGCVFVQGNYERALVPNVYKSFRTKPNVNPYFLQYLFSTGLLDKQLKGIISSTARMDGLLNVSDQDFYNMSIHCPSLEEQDKISNFLELLDQKIEQCVNYKKTLEMQKQAFMQQMFI